MSTTLSPSPSAAHRVLTTPQFFRVLTSWVSGWPGLVLQRWQAFKGTRTQGTTDDYAFTKMLVHLDDRRTLELVLQTVWRRPEDSTTLCRFRFRLDDAVAMGDVRLVRRTFVSNEWIRRNVTVWTWFTAVAYFRGDAQILNLLHREATPAWTASRIRSQLFRPDLVDRAVELFCTVDVACLQWFVNAFGAASLPHNVLRRLDPRIVQLPPQPREWRRLEGTKKPRVKA